MRRDLAKGQWLPAERLQALQLQRLRLILRQAYAQVPYYRDVFDSLRARPEDIKSLEDFRAFPLLTKSCLREQGARLYADDRHRYDPRPIVTSGTSGQRLEVLMDKSANVLEFNYYWRFWGWAGYRLGRPFAECSSVFFKKDGGRRASPYAWSPLGRRLLLNTLELSTPRVRLQVRELWRRGVRFLKGLPSVLSHFARIATEAGERLPRLEAVFSQGEVLLPSQRRRLKAAFQCQVFDSYGQTERVAAISECEHGGLHVVSDYGLLELETVDEAADPGSREGGKRARLIGTGLYNLAMPLLRYELGDFAEVAPVPRTCACGRAFPLVERLLGRESAAIVTPDGRIITAAFLVFEDFDQILGGKIHQTGSSTVAARIATAPAFKDQDLMRLRDSLAALVGNDMTIEVETVPSLQELRSESGKISS